MKKYCIRCRSKDITEHLKSETFNDRITGKQIISDVHYSRCNNCGHDFVTPKQAQQCDKITAIARKNSVHPIHAGAILHDEFMKPSGITANALSIALRVPPTRIHAIVNKKRSITPDTALRLARYFNTSVEFWLTLQNSYDIETAKQHFSPEEIQPLQPAMA